MITQFLSDTFSSQIGEIKGYKYHYTLTDAIQIVLTNDLTITVLTHPFIQQLCQLEFYKDVICIKTILNCDITKIAETINAFNPSHFISIEPYTYPTCDIFYNDQYVMTCHNDVELCRARYQIALKKLDGYTVKFQNEIISISNDGKLSHAPNGFYDQMANELFLLLQLKHNN